MFINVMLLQYIRFNVYPSDAVEANTRVSIFPPEVSRREG